METGNRVSIRQKFKITKLPQNRDYEWLCVHGPGWFRLNLFRLSDIEFRPEEPCCWPDGVEFQNLYRPEKKIIQRGRIKTVFDMPTRCNQAWAIYSRFCEVSESLEKSGSDPKRNPDYSAALTDLRAHLAACPECQDGIHSLIMVAKDLPSYAEDNAA